jgi:hypothetical protein
VPAVIIVVPGVQLWRAIKVLSLSS